MSRRKRVWMKEAIDFVLNSSNSDCNTSVIGLYSDEEDDLDCLLENNDYLEDLR